MATAFDHRTVSRFAEALSLGKSIADASRGVGVSYEDGCAILRKIKQGLGTQAQ